MDTLLGIRDPKGGGVGRRVVSSSSGGGYRYVGGGYHGGSSGRSIPAWAYAVIVLGSVWLLAFIFLTSHWFRRERLNRNRNRNRDDDGDENNNNDNDNDNNARLLGRVAAKALLYMTGIQVFIWAFRKIRSRGSGTKADGAEEAEEGKNMVGGGFYKKADEEERGVVSKEGCEQHVSVTPSLPLPPMTTTTRLPEETAPPPAYSNDDVR
ncbi:hypothetical protein F4811DRAFT_534499 [Daldinia bambusicola]|nr:hypothetical protein F4811DRAFT_534499 [Daldinia bambusicola]